MSQILVGTTANDGTGDPLRTAFLKINQAKVEYFNVKYYGAKGDGATDDRAAVLAACNAARTAGGGVVYMPSATYQMSGTSAADYLTLDGNVGGNYRNVWIQGDAGTVWRVGTGSVITTYLVLVQNNTNFRIQGITFSYVLQPTVRNDTGPKGIRVTGCTDVAIEDCEITGSPQYGLGIETTTRPAVRRCVIHDTMADGINCNSCTRIRVVDNAVTATGDDGIAISTPLLAPVGQQGEDSIVAWNTITNSAGRGVLVLGVGVTIAGNSISLTSGSSILIKRDTAAADPGLRARGITISANSCRSANTSGTGTGPNGGNRLQAGATGGGGAIQVCEANATTFSNGSYHENIVIAGNDIQDSQRCGILVQDVKGCTISGNTIANPCVLNDAAYNYGIYAFSANAIGIFCNMFVNEPGTMTNDVFATSIGTAMSAWGNGGSKPNSVTSSAPARWDSFDGRSVSVDSTLNFVGMAIALTQVVLTDAASIVTLANAGNYFTVTIAGNRTMAAPTNFPANGQRITYTIIQDGVGGRTMAWNAVFKVTWSDTGNTLNKRSSISFIYDGTNWNQDGAQTAYV